MDPEFERWVSEKASEALRDDLEGWQITNALEAKTARFWIDNFIIAIMQGRLTISAS